MDQNLPRMQHFFKKTQSLLKIYNFWVLYRSWNILYCQKSLEDLLTLTVIVLKKWITGLKLLRFTLCDVFDKGMNPYIIISAMDR